VETLTRLAVMLQDLPLDQFMAIEEALRSEIARLSTMIRRAGDG
jgi:hypothetical protein